MYRLRIVHEYFTGACTAFECRLSKHSAEICQQQGLLFRRLAEDEWAICCDGQFAMLDKEEETIELDLSIRDPLFSSYTDWDGFNPMASYSIDLPGKGSEHEASKELKLKAQRRSIGSGFCSVRLRLNAAMVRSSQDNNPVSDTLMFRACQKAWEYILIPRSNTLHGKNGSIALENMSTGACYATSEWEEYGLKCHRAMIEPPIPMRNAYDIRLRLVQLDDAKRKRTILSKVETPVPGRFPSLAKGILRQVCYF